MSARHLDELDRIGESETPSSSSDDNDDDRQASPRTRPVHSAPASTEASSDSRIGEWNSSAAAVFMGGMPSLGQMGAHRGSLMRGPIRQQSLLQPAGTTWRTFGLSGDGNAQALRLGRPMLFKSVSLKVPAAYIECAESRDSNRNCCTRTSRVFCTKDYSSTPRRAHNRACTVEHQKIAHARRGYHPCACTACPASCWPPSNDLGHVQLRRRAMRRHLLP